MLEGAEGVAIRVQWIKFYPIVDLDCIHVKVRDHGSIQTKAVYLVIGINLAGEKEV